MIFTPLAEKISYIVFDGLLYQHHHCDDTSIMIHDPPMWWLCFLKPPKCIVIAHQSSISSSFLPPRTPHCVRMMMIWTVEQSPDIDKDGAYSPHSGQHRGAQRVVDHERASHNIQHPHRGVKQEHISIQTKHWLHQNVPALVKRTMQNMRTSFHVC